jgi:hypothetical protein
MPESVFNSWANYVVEVLKTESDLAGSLTSHPTLIGDAREAIVQNVLKRILPPAYEIGRGQIVDSSGAKSKQIDIIIARSDSPSLPLPGGDKIYIVESVMATLEIKSRLNEEGLVQALDNCASVAELVPLLHGPTKRRVLRKRKIAQREDGTYFHERYLEFQRLTTVGYPATYIFGYKGYIRKPAALLEAVEGWLQKRDAQARTSYLRHLPSLIATEGCFAFRNDIPFQVSPTDEKDEPTHYPAGTDANPLRLLIYHLLNVLFARMPWAPDLEGLRMEPRGYLAEMPFGGYEGGLTFPEPPGYRQAADGPSPIDDRS